MNKEHEKHGSVRIWGCGNMGDLRIILGNIVGSCCLGLRVTYTYLQMMLVNKIEHMFITLEKNLINIYK
jgi:hypothetical protein